MRRTVIGSLIGIVSALVIGVAPAAAAGGWSLFGDATLTTGNNSPTGVQLTSVDSSTFSGIDFAVPAGMTLAQVQTLATDYKFTDNSCGGGSPRFQVNVTTPSGTKNLFVYIGPEPSYTGCTTSAWLNSGNLADSSNLVDATQLGGGFYETFANVIAEFGNDAVTGIQLVADAGWVFASTDDTQTVVVDNVQINNNTFTFESAASCKDGGWSNFTTLPGPFKNQGDCVSFFASGGRNS